MAGCKVLSQRLALRFTDRVGAVDERIGPVPAAACLPGRPAPPRQATAPAAPAATTTRRIMAWDLSRPPVGSDS